MCGGIGSRFWPYSRQDRPKQFIDFFGTGRSLLQMSWDRIQDIVPPSHVLVVTNEKYADLVREQLPDLDPTNLLLEPARRNTAPCIAWAASHLLARDPEAALIVTPSDHLITRENVFIDCVRRGFDFVEHRDALLTFGIKPTRPETGYGYIQIGKEVEPGFSKVKTFTEKPDLELARVLVDSGEFFWNSGIFLYRAQVIMDAMHQYAPDLWVIFDNGRKDMDTPREAEFIKRNFPSCPAISIDYAVMEKAQNVYVECVDFGWNDLGTWSALYDHSPHNPDGNVTQNCRVLAYESTNNIVTAEGDKLVVMVGLDGYVVADTGDVLLLCPKSQEQRIKLFVNDTKMAYGDKYL